VIVNQQELYARSICDTLTLPHGGTDHLTANLPIPGRRPAGDA
jgi:hypothetical protein